MFMLAYVVAIPAVVCCYLGFGRAGSVGTAVVKSDPLASTLTISDVVGQWDSLRLDKDYFTTTDGFIAFNLSKTIVHTVNAYTLLPTDSLFYGLSNPIIDRVFGPNNVSYGNPYITELPLFGIEEPIEIPDARSQWTVAPIFKAPANCLKYPPPLHATCMIPHKIIGWAVATDVNSFCRSIASGSCGAATSHRVSVYYPEEFNASSSYRVGMSGIATSPPPDFIVEAFRRRFAADGWPIDVDPVTYPSGMPNVWVQPVQDVSAVMESARSSFRVFSFIAVALIVLVGLLMIYPLYLDLTLADLQRLAR